MKPVLTDRLAVILLWAAAAVWAGVLTVLWGWTFDPSGGVSWQVAAGLAAGAALALHRRRQRVRRDLRRIDRWGASEQVPLRAALAGELGHSRGDIEQRLKLLTAAAIGTVAVFCLATLWVPLAGWACAMTGQRFLFSDLTWRGIEWFWILTGTVPAGGAIVALWYAIYTVRSGGGRDVYAAACRDAWCGLALASAVGALAWACGANLIYLAFAAGVVMLIVALTTARRRQLSLHPRVPMAALGQWTASDKRRIVLLYCLFVVAIVTQVRMLQDIFALEVPYALLWVAASLGLFAGFGKHLDHKGKLPTGVQRAGCLIGVATAMMVQSFEWILCLSQPENKMMLVGFAAVTQIPLAFFAASLVSGQRHRFATLGGTVGHYSHAAAFGVLCGWVLLGMIAATGVPGAFLIGIAVGLLVAGSIEGARHAIDRSQKIGWLGWSTILTACLLTCLCIAMTRSAGPGVRFAAGTWLTTQRQLAEGGKIVAQGCLPRSANARSETITACLDDVLTRRPGKWWCVVSDALDVPATLPKGVYAFGSHPQPIADDGDATRWPPLSSSDRDFLRYARLNFVAEKGCDVFDGILLAPLPADHPQQWRVMNARTMDRVVRMRNRVQLMDGRIFWGVIALRTQCGPENVGRLLSIARTYYDAVGSGWMVVGISDRGVDMLLLGPTAAVRQTVESEIELAADLLAGLQQRAGRESTVELIELKNLWARYPDVSPMKIVAPLGMGQCSTPTLEQFTKDARELSTPPVPAERKDTP